MLNSPLPTSEYTYSIQPPSPDPKVPDGSKGDGDIGSPSSDGTGIFHSGRHHHTQGQHAIKPANGSIQRERRNSAMAWRSYLAGLVGLVEKECVGYFIRFANVSKNGNIHYIVSLSIIETIVPLFNSLISLRASTISQFPAPAAFAVIGLVRIPFRV